MTISPDPNELDEYTPEEPAHPEEYEATPPEPTVRPTRWTGPSRRKSSNWTRRS